ncbi:MAG: tetratricopeptide repeat protein [Chitinispirillia bacterium]|nr:tetratricopeptide repeat protein [Chitinispirillia bacterium]MCL2242125.1 tetratricopeptide repeat protein [Chitinispirillia bacterium]
MKLSFTRFFTVSLIVAGLAAGAFADETFFRMIKAENWAEAVKYADESGKLPPPERNGQVWAAIGLAHENLKAPEKALACYRVGMGMDDKNHDIYLGAARVYNLLKQPNDAMDMAKKAMEIRASGEASWEFARACISLGKANDAKKALENVTAADANNVVANRELGRIYYEEKDFAKALPLMKRSLSRQADSDLALRIALAHKELGQNDSAIAYFNRAANDKTAPKPEVLVELGRMYYAANDHRNAAASYEKANKSLLTGDDFFRWGTSLENNKADAKAISDAFAEAVKKFGNATTPSALAAREKVGRACIARKAWKDAESALAPLHRADPDGKTVPDILLLMAQVNEGLNNNSAAITLLERAISRDNKNVEAYARLSELYVKSNQADKAKATQEKLVSLDPNNPKIHLSLGDYHLKAGKFNDALQSYQRSFTLDGSPEAAIGMMNAAWNLKRLDMARDAAESALHKDPSLKEPQLMLVNIYMAEKNYRGARGILLPLLKTEDKNLDLWKALAVCSEATNQVTELADADKRIIALDPKDVPSRQRVAKSAEAAGDLKTATAVLKELAALRPQDSNIQKSLYEIAMKQKDNAAAMTHLRAFLALKPDDAVAHRDLGNMQFEAKDTKSALVSYRNAVKADPRIRGMYKNYASILMRDKAPAAELMPVLVAAVEANEADEAIFTAAGQEYQKQNNHPKAAEMFQKALTANPKNMANLTALAEAQEKSGKVSDAILTYEQATAMNPAASREFKALGDLYLQQKRMPQAVAAYKKYLEKVPNDVATARVVGDHEFTQKNWTEANKYYAMVTGDEAKKPDFLKNHAVSRFEAKDFVRAGSLFKQISDANPKDADALKKLYEIEMQNRNTTGAIQNLRKYVALVPNDAEMQKQLGDMLFDSRDSTGALAAYKAALRLDPATKGVHKRHVDLLRRAPAAEQMAALRAAIAANEADAAMYAQLGDLHRAANNCREAIPMLEKASQMDKNNTRVLAAIADCQVKNGNINAAVLVLEQVTMLNPGATSEFKTLGDLYVQQKKVPQAVAAYKKFLEKGSDDAAAKLVGEEAFRAKQWADAVRFLGMVKSAEANTPAFREMLGKAAFENKDNARAVDIYRQLAAASPQNAEYVKMQYELAVRMGAREDVVTHLRRYVQLQPRDAAMQKQLGDLLYDRKDRPGALAAYRAALAADPSTKGFHKRIVELVDAGGTPAEKIAAMEAASAANESDSPMLIKLANIYRDQKQPAKAVPLLEKASNAERSNIQLLLALAQCQEAAGMTDQAIATYLRYLVMDPKATKEQKTLGDLYMRQKKTAEAMRAYKTYLETYRTDNATALLVAREAYNAKQWADASRYFAMVSGDSAKVPATLKMYGTAAFEAKDNARALTVLRELVGLTPRDADVLKMLEEVARRTGANDMAVQYLQQYVALAPNDTAASRRLGDLLFDRKDEAGALAAYRNVLRVNPKATGFHKKLVGIVMKSGTDAEKLTALTTAIEAGEGDVPMYGALGGIYKSRNDFTRAAAMYQEAVKLQPNNGVLLGHLADCQLKSGNLAGAAQNLQQAIVLNPKAVDEHRTLGDLYMQQKRTDQAIASYKTFLDKTQTPDPKIAQQVGDEAFNKRQWADAYKYLSMVKDNSAADFLFRLGKSAQESGNSKAAVDALERFRVASRPANARAPQHPNRAEALKMLIAAYEKEGDGAKASAMIDEFLKGPPPIKDQELAFKRGMLMEAKDTAGAMRIYEENTSVYPRDHRNFLKVGIYLTRRGGGNAAKAIQMLEKSVGIVDSISRAWYELGMLYGAQKRDKDMMRAFEKFITYESKNATPILRVGEYLMTNRKMPNEAMMFLEMANALKPNDGKTMSLLATGYMQTGRVDEGIKLLERMVRSQRGTPVDIEVRIALADGYLTLSRFMEAAVEWKAVTDQKREPQYLIKYATALVGTNRNAEANTIANEILRSQPDNIEALMLSGRVKVAMRNYEDANESFRKVLFANPNHAPALYERANIFLLQQNFDGAKAFFDRALKVDPKYALAELGLARVAKAQKNENEYKNRLQRAQRLDPNNREIQAEMRK